MMDHEWENPVDRKPSHLVRKTGYKWAVVVHFCPKMVTYGLMSVRGPQSGSYSTYHRFITNSVAPRSKQTLQFLHKHIQHIQVCMCCFLLDFLLWSKYDDSSDSDRSIIMWSWRWFHSWWFLSSKQRLTTQEKLDEKLE